MKLGLFSYSYHLAFGKHDVFTPSEKNKMDIFGFMDRAYELGFDGIQIDICHLESHEDSYLEKVGNYARNKNFYIEYGSTGISEDHTLKELEITRKLGANLMRTFMGFDRYIKGTDVSKEISYAVKILKEVEVKAKEYDIKIAIENHCDATVDEIISLMEQVHSPYIGMCVDLGNFMIHLEKPEESVRKLAPYIINTHFKDYAVHMENWGFKTFGVPLGEGMINLNEVLKILEEESKLDRIMLEIPVEKEDTEEKTLAKEDDYVAKSATYAREVLKIKDKPGTEDKPDKPGTVQ